MRMPLFAVFVALTTLSATACGDGHFTDVKIPLTIPLANDHEIDFGDYCSEKKNQSVCGNVALHDAPIELPPQEFGLKETITKNFKEADGYVESIKSVEIDELTYTVSENTLNRSIPSIVFYVGPVAAKSTSDEGIKVLLSIPAIREGQNPKDATVKPDDNSKAAAGKVLVQDKFKLFPVLLVKQGSKPISGKLKLTAKAKVSVTVNISDAITAGAKDALQRAIKAAGGGSN